MLAATLHSPNPVEKVIGNAQSRERREDEGKTRPPRLRRGASFLLVPALALLAGGCRSLEMTPRAEQVAVAGGKDEVELCKMRGEVFALAPFRSPDEPIDQLKIRADVIGADTLVILDNRTEQRKDWHAKAYRCRGRATTYEAMADRALPVSAP